ncbi:thermonuclease family protein [Pseudohalioglobus lutimaris]|uniref:thermonuclease family protein n=1 Tax=Pseudohalioglobus lutimaris TaxID=1737061 RepID=UPI00096B92DA|nr:thermonuclease family protein [Pseudohalioglobus lutimaris]
MLRIDAVSSRRQFHFGLALFLCLGITACSRDGQTQPPQVGPGCLADTGNLERRRVERVVDGDTLHLVGGDRVRLVGVNTPEIGRDGRADEPLARDAQRALAEMLSSAQEVWLQDGKQRSDRYGRRLAHAFDGDGVSISGRLIARGLGFHVVIAPNDRYASCLQAEEAHARSGRSGVWNESAFAATPVVALQPGQGGFTRVSDRVTRVSFKQNGWWVQLGGKVGVQIDGDARSRFSRAQLRSLQGREVEVRGWLIPMKGDWWMMSLDHPSMLHVVGDSVN